ncbi:uncharacterized protein LOC122194540 [Lactuca sativa]|uniref:uncharacterized protein LOC122194540 n=1 Tax=Lactuca sativa TaxID=4236 RepID=UPI001C68DDAF|nr:uncharacterized protein LOC122194540 [Lactuca sativa]
MAIDIVHDAEIQQEVRHHEINDPSENSKDEKYHGANGIWRELSEIKLSTLLSIIKVLVDCSSVIDQLCVTKLILHDQQFFQKLMDLFRVCEDLKNYEDLHIIYKIIKRIILISPQILEKIFSDELIVDIVGCLEYDPDVPHVCHCNLLKTHVFKEPIPVKNSLASSKMHQAYKVSYLKDVVLPRLLDEVTIASLNSIIHSNNRMVVTMLKDDTNFVNDLFTRNLVSEGIFEVIGDGIVHQKESDVHEHSLMIDSIIDENVALIIDPLAPLMEAVKNEFIETELVDNMELPPTLIEKIKEEVKLKTMKVHVYENDCLQVGDLKYVGNLTKQSVIEVGEVFGHEHIYVTLCSVVDFLDQHIKKHDIKKGRMGVRVVENDVLEF